MKHHSNVWKNAECYEGIFLEDNFLHSNGWDLRVMQMMVEYWDYSEFDPVPADDNDASHAGRSGSIQGKTVGSSKRTGFGNGWGCSVGRH